MPLIDRIGIDIGIKHSVEDGLRWVDATPSKVAQARSALFGTRGRRRLKALGTGERPPKRRAVRALGP